MNLNLRTRAHRSAALGESSLDRYTVGPAAALALMKRALCGSGKMVGETGS